ncbi:MAG: hypothetical protein ABIV11_10280 [Gemmatimonadaceae bacterium]
MDSVVSQAGTEPVDGEYLDEVLDNQFVQASLCGLGASSGLAVVMVIKSMLDRPLRVQIRDGTLLRNSGSAQNMVLRRTEFEADAETAQEIGERCAEIAQSMEEQDRVPDWRPLVSNWMTLQPDVTHTFLLSAYCLDFEKDNPGSTSSFAVEPGASGETARLFTYLRTDSTNSGVAAIQLAVWALNGDLSAAQIRTEFAFSEADRINACGLLDAAQLSSESRRLCAS